MINGHSMRRRFTDLYRRTNNTAQSSCSNMLLQLTKDLLLKYVSEFIFTGYPIPQVLQRYNFCNSCPMYPCMLRSFYHKSHIVSTINVFRKHFTIPHESSDLLIITILSFIMWNFGSYGWSIYFISYHTVHWTQPGALNACDSSSAQWANQT